MAIDKYLGDQQIPMNINGVIGLGRDKTETDSVANSLGINSY
jgi:hypothetical protein